MFFSFKKEDFRLVVDYRKLNSQIKYLECPTPTIESALLYLNKAKYLTVLDLNSAYHQIGLTAESKNTEDKEIVEMLTRFFEQYPDIANEVVDNPVDNQSLTVNVNEISENESIIANIDPEEQNDQFDDDATVHSNADGNTVITIPIIEGPINPTIANKYFSEYIGLSGK